jgi:LmbE family N-acetylglucosaminyl deacetylase
MQGAPYRRTSRSATGRAVIQIISPHPDDAVLSLGQYMAVSHPRVVTVFAGVPAGGLSDYDRSCGFESSATAMWERRLEDDKACATLGATPEHLDFLDRQYRPHWDAADLDAYADEIIAALRSLKEAPTFAPLGIGHPDHELVGRCCLEAFGGRSDFFLYEEAPYRTLRPEEAAAALDAARAAGFTLEQYFPHTGPRSAKETALHCYRSQIGDELDPCFLVPERMWRATR